MTSTLPTQQSGDKMKKALELFSELLKKKPDVSRGTLLNEVEIKFDLSPRECEFLNNHFSKEN